MLDFFQELGRRHSLKEALKIFAIGAASMLAFSLSIQGGILE